MVFVKPSEEIEPSEGSFDLQTAFLGDEPFLGFGLLGDLYSVAVVARSPLELALIGVVSTDKGQVLGLLLHLPEQVEASQPVVDVGCGDMDGQGQPQSVNR